MQRRGAETELGTLGKGGKGSPPKGRGDAGQMSGECVQPHPGSGEAEMWAVQGTAGLLSRLCHRNGSCELRKRGSVCYLEKNKSFTAAANGARGARVMPMVLA